MIFSENRYPPFRIMLWNAPRTNVRAFRLLFVRAPAPRTGAASVKSRWDKHSNSERGGARTPLRPYRCPGMLKRDRPAVYPFAPIPFGAIVAAVFGITGLVIAIRRLF